MRGVAFTLLLLALLSGCNQYQPQLEKNQIDENQTSSILSQLTQEKINLATFRTVVEQLNRYYDYHGDTSKKQLALTPAQDAVLKELLSQNKNDFERARRIDEVRNRLFSTQADANYLDACLLFSEAVNSLTNDLGDVPSKGDNAAQVAYQTELANYIFGWTMRQVALKSNPPNVKDWPAHELLRVGGGDAEDRLRVFLGMLGQSNLDACALVINTQVRQDNIVENRQVPILACVLLNNKLYVFDTYSGKAVPGAAPGSIATLEEVKKNPALLAKRPDAPTATQLAEAELVCISSICGLAPRMETLEKEFDNIKVNVKLKDDVAARLDRFKAAGYTVKPWAAPNRNGYPGLVHQYYVESSKGDPRLTEMIIPWNKLIPAYYREASAKITFPGTPSRLFTEFDRLFVNLRLEPGGGRDLLVRGKPYQAVERISKLENNIDRALDAFHKEMPYTVPQFREVALTAIIKKMQQYARTQQEALSLTKGSPEEARKNTELRTILTEIEGFWNEPNVRQLVKQLGAEWAIPDMREHLTYFMGLAKMELAIRAEMQARKNPNAVRDPEAATPLELYTSASAWFDRYEALILPTNSAMWLDAVKVRHQECLAKQAELEAAKPVQAAK